MADNWSETERQTNRLIRSLFAWLLNRKKLGPDELLGLTKLTWITASRVNEDTCIESVKIPALGQIFGCSYHKTPLIEVARDVTNRTGNPNDEQLVLNPTGFTNIYNAYRNSSAEWMRSNFQEIMPLARGAFQLRTDAQGRSLAEKIEDLPLIGKTKQATSSMHPASLLTPLMFSLDRRIRFPIINGREHVQRILAKRGADRGTLAQKYDAMIGLYGRDPRCSRSGSGQR